MVSTCLQRFQQHRNTQQTTGWCSVYAYENSNVHITKINKHNEQIRHEIKNYSHDLCRIHDKCTYIPVVEVCQHQMEKENKKQKQNIHV